MQQYVSSVTQMLNDLARKGNATAQLRLKELDLLQQMTTETMRREARQREEPSVITPDATSIVPAFTPYQYTAEWAGTMEDISVSHTQILSLAQQLDGLHGSDFDLDIGIGDLEPWM